MERYKVKIYPSAQQDLRDIVDYLNTLSPSAALRYYDKLTDAASRTTARPRRRCWTTPEKFEARGPDEGV